MPMRSSRGSLRGNDRGAVAIIVAVFMLVALVLLAFVIDRGRIYLAQSQLQNAVDAGALAGAQEFCVSGGDAVGVAETFAASNGAANATAVVQSGDVSYVNVRATETLDLFFGPFVSTETATVAAQATASRECLIRYRIIAIDRVDFEGGGVDMREDPIFAGECFTANKGLFGVVRVTSAATDTCPQNKPPIDNGYSSPEWRDVAQPYWASAPITAASAATSAGVDPLVAAALAAPNLEGGLCKDAKSNTWNSDQPISCTGTGPPNALDVPSDAYDQVIIAEGDINLPNSGTMTNALIYSERGSIRIPAGLNISGDTILYAPEAGTEIANTGNGSGQIDAVLIGDAIRVTGGHMEGTGGAYLPGPGPFKLIQ